MHRLRKAQSYQVSQKVHARNFFLLGMTGPSTSLTPNICRFLLDRVLFFFSFSFVQQSRALQLTGQYQRASCSAVVRPTNISCTEAFSDTHRLKSDLAQPIPKCHMVLLSVANLILSGSLRIQLHHCNRASLELNPLAEPVSAFVWRENCSRLSPGFVYSWGLQSGCISFLEVRGWHERVKREQNLFGRGGGGGDLD